MEDHDDNGNPYSDDDGIEDLPSETLLQLEENAYAANQRQRAESENLLYGYGPDRARWQQQRTGQHQLFQQKQRDSTSATAYDGSTTASASASASGPYRGTVNPGISFGDTDLQYLDTGVLDDGAGPVPADQQDAVVILDHQQPEEREAIQGGATAAAAAAADRRTREPATTSWQLYGQDLGDDNGDSGNNLANRVVHDDAGPVRSLADAEPLREQVEQLTRERETMLQELGATKAMVETRAGEIAIIRANQEKLQRTHDEQLASLRSAMTEQVRKHHAEVEATAMESKRVMTENAFLRQDRHEETFREKERERVLKAQDKGDGKGKVAERQAPVTPKKSRTLPFRDGFDDDEIMGSPSKSGGRRSGRGTPTAQGKRKRRVTDDSPRGSMLELSQSFEGGNQESADTIPVDEGGEEGQKRLAERPHSQDGFNVHFMRSILNHRTSPNKLHDLEVFASMSFPSQPDQALSSFILEATTTNNSSSTSSPSHSNYAIAYAKAVISLWSRALKEVHYTPINMLMAVTKFVLSLDIRRLAPPLLADLVPVLCESAYVNGMVRFRNSPNWHLNRGQAKQTPLRELHPEVNGTEALEILYMIASSGCLDSDNDNNANNGAGSSAFAEFWTRIRFDFVLMMLNAYQPVTDITLVLNLLSCSIQGQPGPNFPNRDAKDSTINDNSSNDYYTFGPIHGTVADQTENENYILDRAGHLLSVTPSVDEGQPPCPPREISALRLEVMYFLTEAAFSSPPPGQLSGGGGGGGGGNGLALLGSHPSVLARIFRAMHDELDALYTTHAEDERSMHAELVNGLTRLAYGVLHASSNPHSDSGATAQQDNEGGEENTGGRAREGGPGAQQQPQPQLNLHTVPGAVQKHLVVLTRLAFSERGALLPASSSSPSSSANPAGVPGRDNGNNNNAEDDNDDEEKKRPTDGASGNREEGSSRGVNVLLEAGIDLETVEMAHEMLEEVVNPQEAEALVEVFRPGLASGEPQEI